MGVTLFMDGFPDSDVIIYLINSTSDVSSQKHISKLEFIHALPKTKTHLSTETHVHALLFVEINFF